MTKNDYSQELSYAVEAALNAGKYLLKNKSNLNVRIESGPKDTKLQADVEAENLIKQSISSISKYPILAEESGKSVENLGDIFWVIDPLDGTANFSRDIPICCVSIGLVCNMKPILGVVYDFNNDDLYKANNITKEAFLNNKEIEVSKIDNKNEAVLVTGLPVNTNYENDSLKKMIEDMQTWKKVRMIGSAAIASCYIASGKAELYKENGVFLWDIIAGAAIIESSGGNAKINNVKDNFQVDIVFSNSHISE
ncbi:MAG: inositol monophosphatase family protein [Gammaproteobacteria bacterium]